jgi:hypothetical protein
MSITRAVLWRLHNELYYERIMNAQTTDGTIMEAQENAILQLTLKLDLLSAKIEEAYRKKKLKYANILSAVQQYIHSGLTIKVLPWVVGIRGFLNTKHLHVALAYFHFSTYLN